jgi:hypothetical protein
MHSLAAGNLHRFFASLRMTLRNPFNAIVKPGDSYHPHWYTPSLRFPYERRQ